MAELTPKERLQPSLLDRLTDEDADKKQEARNRRVFSVRRLRKSVIRDLGWLLNTASLDATEDLGAYPEVQASVVNYGMPDLAGVTASSIDPSGIERAVRAAIQVFEPRLLKNSIVVRARTEPSAMGRNSMTFEIEAMLWAQPTPTRLFLRTGLDLEDGAFTVSELGGGGSD